MHKINFKKPLTSLGRPVVDHQNNPQLVHSEIAFYLNSMNTGNALKNTSICLRIFEKGEIELDQSDLEFLKRNLTGCQTAPDYLIAAALQCLEDAEELKE